MRDDFATAAKTKLAKRVGFRCSNPDCRKQTSGPESDGEGVVNMGVAAHITAAAQEGPRYDASLSPEDRKSTSNGIWLCRQCAHLVDEDEGAYPVEHLQRWKTIAEATAALEVHGYTSVPDSQSEFEELQRDMADLINEMRSDVQNHPDHREFILLEKGWSYNAGGNPVLVYYFEEHNNLRQKIRILENHGFVIEINSSNVDRFLMSEAFVRHLRSTN